MGFFPTAAGRENECPPLITVLGKEASSRGAVAGSNDPGAYFRYVPLPEGSILTAGVLQICELSQAIIEWAVE